MTLRRLAWHSLRYYWRTHAAVTLGVASAVAALAGALLVGYSVRESLLAITTGRLGHTALAIATDHPIPRDLAERLTPRLSAGTPPARAEIAALFTLTGTVLHESSGRRANDVTIYGVDAAFLAFHGVHASPPAGADAALSPDLAGELQSATGDALVLRVSRPTDVPIDSLHGRRDDAGKSLRRTTKGTWPREQMGEFSLAPGQGPVRAVFVSLDRLQADLLQPNRANLFLIKIDVNGTAPNDAAKTVRDALAAALSAEDVGVRVEMLPGGSRTILVESAGGLINDATAAAITGAASRESLASTPVLTWLANRMTVAGRTTPYSLVSAIGSHAAGDKRLAALLDLTSNPNRSDAPTPPIVLNDWAARDLGAAAGDALELEYYRWADEGRLVTERASFRVAGVVPLDGLAADRRLAPAYPGVTEARGMSDWDPPFPIELRLVRPIDEAYWDRHRTAPKAFIPLSTGQRLWKSRYGQLTSIRLSPAVPSTPAATPPSAPPDLAAIALRLKDAVARGVAPASAGVLVVDVRAQNLEAAAGATDFGAYFSYFGFFLMVSALLLAALFFRLSIEQRLAQIGVLRACGYPVKTIRTLWLIEGGVVSSLGAAVGVGLATAWAAFMMHGLATWWIGAVGTTRLQLHVDWVSLAAGALGGGLAAAASIAFTVWRLNRASPRQLLTGSVETAAIRRGRGHARLSIVALATAVGLTVIAAAGLMPAAGGFFGAGTLVLAGGLLAFRAWLGRSSERALTGLGRHALVRLGLNNASWRPGRSLTCAGLVAGAVFLIVSVEAFRKGASWDSGPASGTGGFALFAEAALPIALDPATPEGRTELGLSGGDTDTALAGTAIVPFRLRPGDDASCLNLYQPKQPRILGVPVRFVEANRFRFSNSIASTDAARQNPWTLLGPADGEGVVPAILDATSLAYIFHARVGDVITIDAATPRPVRLRVVGALADSVLQGEVLIAERAFLALYPQMAGYRVWLVDVSPATPERIGAVSKTIETRLEPYGIDAVETAARLAAFHRVENTYLSTFQTLGGLGLVLGTLGLAAVIARNVFERRRELALLGAAGFGRRDLRTVVLAEHLALVAAGLVIGTTAALVAIVPVLSQRGGGAPWLALVWLAIVALTGLGTTLLATRRVRRLPLVASLRSE